MKYDLTFEYICIKINKKIYKISANNYIISVFENQTYILPFLNKINDIPLYRYTNNVIGFNNNKCLYECDLDEYNIYGIYEFMDYYITYEKNIIIDIYRKLTSTTSTTSEAGSRAGSRAGINNKDYWFWQNVPIYTCKYIQPSSKGYGKFICTENGIIFYKNKMLSIKFPDENFIIYEHNSDLYIKYDGVFYNLFNRLKKSIDNLNYTKHSFIKIPRYNQSKYLKYYYKSINELLCFILCLKNKFNIKLPKYIIYLCY